MKVKLVKSLNGRIKNQILTAHSLGLRKIGDVSTQPDTDATKGKIRVVAHLVEVSE
jgi:large subunit ribosomal protein L30